jgi:hypothetical protein
MNIAIEIVDKQVEIQGMAHEAIRVNAYVFGMGDLHIEKTIPLHLRDEPAYREHMIHDMVREVVSAGLTHRKEEG